MSTATQIQTQQKSSIPYHQTTHKSAPSPYQQPPTESMVEAAKIDYATRLFLYTQQQLQQVYSSPSDKERKNKGFTYKDYDEIRDQKVKRITS
ncbi:hypothetical protein C1645_880842 [Glomus cerebriforme]|uniref:Uncharacterized protein n=1 Tax=Glomus cerebriforme TaxID=658196 RepID=A0A397SEZ4_9GLOM|nr:hypothetical protein C1645_880842 [Glomus cerebriforme]